MEINDVICENDTKITMTGMHKFQILNVGAHPRKWLLNNKTVCVTSQQQTDITYQWTPLTLHSGPTIRYVALRSGSVENAYFWQFSTSAIMRLTKNWHPYFTSHNHHNNTGKTENHAPCIPWSKMWKTVWAGLNHNSSPPVIQQTGHMRGYLCNHKWAKHDEWNFLSFRWVCSNFFPTRIHTNR
jgi:hypothetical protein